MKQPHMISALKIDTFHHRCKIIDKIRKIIPIFVKKYFTNRFFCAIMISHSRKYICRIIVFIFEYNKRSAFR